ncbi:MAG TPA: tripartite tricarboxylate transporter substrate binding protein [Burkholderiales bacterium]|nr:tripartite tricarboxylate transporter substrate binding protein [Burkholderiales bacterium]
MSRLSLRFAARPRKLPLLRLGVAIVLAGTSFVTLAQQDFPNRPIRMIAPFTPGAGADVLARMLARKLTEVFHRQIVVDNRGGAAGIIGSDIVARAAPDGYTILFVTGSHASNAAIGRRLPYDTVKDFAPVSLFVSVPSILVVHPSFPARSVPELIALARSKPGQIDYASGTLGTAAHFAAEMFKAYAKVDLNHISYRGPAEAMIDVLAGKVPIIFLGPASVLSHVKAGRLRALAITSAKRSPAWPDLPTMQEGGVPNYDFKAWYGVLGPRSTPTRIVARLSQAVHEAVQDPALTQPLTADGFEVYGGTPEQFRQFLLREIAMYTDLVHAIGGIRLE